MADALLQKIFDKAIIQPNGCLEWQGAKSKNGYGQVYWQNKVIYTHRAIATIYHGQPSEGQEVLHSCDNRSCCSPSHLSWGTRKQNMEDASNKKRLLGRTHVSGEAHPSSKLTWKQVQNVRQMRKNGKTLKEIALMFEVSLQAIHNITKGKVRKNG